MVEAKVAEQVAAPRRCWQSISPNRRTQWPEFRARDGRPRRRQVLVARTRTFCVNLNNGSTLPQSDSFRSEIESAAGAEFVRRTPRSRKFAIPKTCSQLAHKTKAVSPYLRES